jgi:RNA polymerase sigma factor (sigma-70 family)
MGTTGHYSDTDLLFALRQGKPPDSAIRHLYFAFFDTASVYIRQNNGSQQDAEDTFQEVVLIFLDLVQKDRFRGETSINNFLYSIVRHLWLNELKRKGRAQKREQKYERENTETDDPIIGYLAGQEARSQLMQIIENLGETCKKILLAFYYEGLPMREILAQLNYQNEQVLRNKKYKCMKQLEETLSGQKQLIQLFKSAFL